MYPGIKTNLFATIGSLMALVLLNGCTAVSSYPYLPAADFLARPGQAILWIYYQSDSGALAQISRPEAEIFVDDKSVGKLRALEHGVIVIDPGKKKISVSFSGFNLTTVYLKPTNSLRINLDLKDSNPQTLSFTSPVTPSAGGTAIFDLKTGAYSGHTGVAGISTAAGSAWFFDDGEITAIKNSKRAFIWRQVGG